MTVALCIVGALAFAFAARWAQKRYSNYTTTMKDAEGNITSQTNGKID